jgi:predicted nucleotidyltransferase component of viral defense system
MKNILKYQQDVLKALSGKVNDFYLAGGTALSLFYFQHRLSVDLDFFTHKFIYPEIARIVDDLSHVLKKKVEIKGQSLTDKTAKIVVYNIHFTNTTALKLDFVEDVVDLIKKTKVVDGINILSLEDIYLRKIYALVGMVRTLDEIGREKFIGGRVDAKDFYDVYFLSHTFMPLSRFVIKYCNSTIIEAVVKWFRTYDRMAMIDGVLTLDTNKAVDCRMVEKHFKKEIDKILEYELGGL